MNAFNDSGNAAAIDTTQLGGNVNLIMDSDTLNAQVVGTGVLEAAGIDFNPSSISAGGALNLIINRSTINVSATGPGVDDTVGIFASSTLGNITITGNQDLFNIRGIGDGDSAEGMAVSPLANANNQDIAINLSNSTLNITADSATIGASASGITTRFIYASGNSFSNNTTIQLSNDSINVTANSLTAANNVTGIQASVFSITGNGINDNFTITLNNVGLKC